MKKIFIVITLASFAVCCFSQTKTKAYLIPEPVQLVYGNDSTFFLPQKAVIITPKNEEVKKIVGKKKKTFSSYSPESFHQLPEDRKSEFVPSKYKFKNKYYI